MWLSCSALKWISFLLDHSRFLQIQYDNIPFGTLTECVNHAEDLLGHLILYSYIHYRFSVIVI